MKDDLEEKKNCTYIVRCADGTYYTGWTNNPVKRLADHNRGAGAKYTKPRRPVELVYLESFETPEQARSREAGLKRLSRKELLCNLAREILDKNGERRKKNFYWKNTGPSHDKGRLSFKSRPF